MTKSSHAEEVMGGERFEFGANWGRFLNVLDDSRTGEAKNSLSKMLGVSSLGGKTFLDAGSGSGLFSLAARMLGANVTSFDFDPKSVACTRELKKRYFDDDPNWSISEGSVLDSEFVRSLGEFDVVYSWGVLHHTGSMWVGLQNIIPSVKSGGQLFVAIYNDQDYRSRIWHFVKKTYCKGLIGRIVVRSIYYPFFMIGGAVVDVLIRHKNPILRYTEYDTNRGMSVFHDWEDWLGGYPFEVAKPENIFDHVVQQGFSLEKLITCGRGLGCNQFVFRKI